MFLAACLLIIFAFSVNAQSVGINATGDAPNGSAILDLSSTTKGFLPPRMTYAERGTIASPAAGLMVWCSNCGAYGELQVFNGTVWTNLTGGAASASVPGAPTIGTATMGNAQASVAFTAPGSNGGSAITSYTATSTPGSFTGTLTQSGSGTITVTGLTNGTAYTFTVTATNATGTGAASAASNSVTPTLAIGQNYGGGIIAYILQSGDPGWVSGETHGLIAAPSDQSTAAQWGCIGTTINGADGKVIGTGAQNTSDIVTGCSTAGIAARICNDLVLNTYTDWYLPSKNELTILYLNRTAIGGFYPAAYWNSTECEYNTNDTAWRQYFEYNTSEMGFDNKSYLSRVRAIRAF